MSQKENEIKVNFKKIEAIDTYEVLLEQQAYFFE